MTASAGWVLVLIVVVIGLLAVYLIHDRGRRP